MNINKYREASIYKYLLISLALFLAVISIFVLHNKSAQADISSGLIGYWELDETSGTTAIDSSSNNNGTLTNGPAWVSGKINNALSFDGVDDFILVPDSNVLEGMSGLTISAWIKPTLTGTDDYQRIADKGTDVYAFYMRSDGRLGASVVTSGTGGGTGEWYIGQFGKTATANTWQHVVFVWDSATAQANIYLNGSAGAPQSRDGDSVATNGSGLRIGDTYSWNNQGDRSFTGLIDEVRIYNRALSQSEIQQLYDGTTPPTSVCPDSSCTGTETCSTCPQDCGTCPVSDTQAPTVPTNLSASAVSSSQINLSWTASSDNVGVTGYKVFRNSTQIATPTTNSYSDTGLSPSTTYTYIVSAFDAVPNTSAQSSPATATTQQQTGGNDVTATSCAKADVQTAVTQVQSAGGGTVHIPAGDCTWSGAPIVIRGTLSTFNIIGAGVGQTIIRLTSGNDSYFWFDDPNRGWTNIGDVRISGFSFIPGIRVLGFQSNGLITFWRVKSFRFDHNYFEAPNTLWYGNTAFLAKNVGKALIDNNWFVQNLLNGYDSYLWELGSTHTPNQDALVNPEPSGAYLDCYHQDAATGCDCQVGSDPQYRTSSVAAGNTVVVKLYEYSSNSGAGAAAVINNTGGTGTGKMQRIYFYINSIGASPTVNLAAFSASGNVLTTRGTALNIPIHVGWNYLTAGVDFTAFNINNGDYLGLYLNNATLSQGARVLGSGGGVTAMNWIKSGNQIPASSVDFGAPTGTAVSLWGEIYDDQNVLSACETAWTAWWNQDPNLERTAGASPARVWNSNYKPTVSDDSGFFFEDNYFQWRQAAIEGNWQSMHKVTMRHNTFQLPTPPYTGAGNTEAQSQPTMKPGAVFTNMHDNAFNYFSFTRNDFSFDGPNKRINMSGTGTWPHPDPNGYLDFRHAFVVGNTIVITGSSSNNKTVTVASISKTQITVNDTLITEAAGSTVTLARSGAPLDGGQGLIHIFMTNGLFYNNVINNHYNIWTIGDGNRTYGTQHMLVPQTRQSHLYIFNNTGYNNICGTVDSLSCTDELQWGANYNGINGYGTTPGTGTFYFRAPQPGETLYGFADYAYPYPPPGGTPPTDTTPPQAPQNVRVN